jgi:hypothetical protein
MVSERSQSSSLLPCQDATPTTCAREDMQAYLFICTSTALISNYHHPTCSDHSPVVVFPACGHPARLGSGRDATSCAGKLILSGCSMSDRLTGVGASVAVTCAAGTGNGWKPGFASTMVGLVAALLLPGCGGSGPLLAPAAGGDDWRSGTPAAVFKGGAGWESAAGSIGCTARPWSRVRPGSVLLPPSSSSSSSSSLGAVSQTGPSGARCAQLTLAALSQPHQRPLSSSTLPSLAEGGVAQAGASSQEGLAGASRLLSSSS